MDQIGTWYLVGYNILRMYPSIYSDVANTTRLGTRLPQVVKKNYRLHPQITWVAPILLYRTQVFRRSMFKRAAAVAAFGGMRM